MKAKILLTFIMLLVIRYVPSLKDVKEEEEMVLKTTLYISTLFYVLFFSENRFKEVQGFNANLSLLHPSFFF